MKQVSTILLLLLKSIFTQAQNTEKTVLSPSKQVKKGQKLNLSLAAGGGTAISIKALSK